MPPLGTAPAPRSAVRHAPEELLLRLRRVIVRNLTGPLTAPAPLARRCDRRAYAVRQRPCCLLATSGRFRFCGGDLGLFPRAVGGGRRKSGLTYVATSKALWRRHLHLPWRPHLRSYTGGRAPLCRDVCAQRLSGPGYSATVPVLAIRVLAPGLVGPKYLPLVFFCGRT